MSDKIDECELEQLENELRPKLSSYMTKSPSQAESNRLIETLRPELERANRVLKPSIFRQSFLQLRQYKWSFWLISIAVFIMLTLSTGYTASITERFADVHPFSFILPLYILVGIAYSYRSWNKEMRMVEMITPFPPALLLLTRILNMIVINLLFGLLGSAYLYLAFDAQPLRFVLSWLAPSLLMFGVLAYVMLWKGIKSGMGTAICVWLLAMIATGTSNQEISPALHEIFPILQCAACLAGCIILFAAFQRAGKQYRFQM